MGPAFVPGDSGPLYLETSTPFAPWLIEPWNTVSNVGFLLIVLVWLPAAFVPGPARAYFRLCLPILALGWLGGTLYHGLRSSEIFYLLDYLPIYILAGITSVWFSRRVLTRVRTVLLVGACLMPAVYQRVWHDNSPGMISLVYAGLAISILLPVALVGWRTGWTMFGWVIASGLAFAFALGFRHFEPGLSAMIPVGTHFLWHLFGALAVHFLLTYLSSESRWSRERAEARSICRTPAS